MNDIERAIAAYLACPPGEPVGHEIAYQVPEDAQIRLDDRYDGSHLLTGATITHWPEDAA